MVVHFHKRLLKEYPIFHLSQEHKNWIVLISKTQYMLSVKISYAENDLNIQDSQIGAHNTSTSTVFQGIGKPQKWSQYKS